MTHTSPALTAALRTSALLLFAAVGTSCDLDQSLVPDGVGLDGPTIMASVVASDGSAPSMNGLTHMDGTVTLQGIDVELWDGVSWFKIPTQVGAATLPLGETAADVSVMPETEIPNADYTRVRLSAAGGEAAVSMTVDGQRFGTDGPLGNGPLVFEREVEIVDRQGVRTFRVALQAITEVTRHVAADGSESLLMTGDLGSSALARTAIVASDGSDAAALGLSALEGVLVLEGMTVDLYDGVDWQPMVDARDAARFRVGHIFNPTPLLSGADLPQGVFTKIRLSADRAWAALALELNGQRYGGEALLGEHVVVEKDLQVLELNGAQLLWMVLETVASVSPATSADGSASVTIDGDFGSATLLPPGRTVTKVVASDGSDPDVEGLDDLEGKLALEGITLELWDEDLQEWQVAVEDRDGAWFHIAEPRDATPLVRSDDLTGNYTRARLSVRRAVAGIALTLGDQRYRGEGVLGEGIVLVKELHEVSEADAFRESDAFTDHNLRILWMVFETVAEVVRAVADDGTTSVLVEGEFGSLTLQAGPPPGMHTAIVASDVSDPKIDAVYDLEGKLFLEGVSLELLDGDQWIEVLEGLEHAAFEIGEGREATLLLRSDDLPDGHYTRARLIARRASARLALNYGDQRFAGHEVLGEGVVVEKEIEIIQSADAFDVQHGRIIWMTFETVIDVALVESSDGARAAVIEGDFGSATLAQLGPGSHTAIVASDASDPEIDALHRLDGKLVLEGISLQLVAENGDVKTAIEYLDEASFEVAEPRSATRLLWSDDMGDANFTQAILSVKRASAGLALHLGDGYYRGEAVLGEDLVLEKSLESLNEFDAASGWDTRVLWMFLETVIEVSRQTSADGTPAVLVEGEFGSAVLPAVPPPTGISFEVIEQVHTSGPSGIAEHARFVIHTADAWEEFWNRLKSNTDPRPDLPHIDFETHQVIVAAMGQRSTGGYAIEIEEIYETDTGITVLVEEVSPGADCFVTQAFTAPVTAVVIARTDATISFKEEKHTRDCS